MSLWKHYLYEGLIFRVGIAVLEILPSLRVDFHVISIRVEIAVIEILLLLRVDFHMILVIVGITVVKILPT